MPYDITYTIEDNDGDTAETAVHVPTGLTVAQYTEFAWRYAQTIETWIFGIFRPLAKLRIPLDVTALTGNVASVDSDVEQLAHFEFETATGNKVSFSVPALNETQIDVGTDEMDVANASIAALIAMFEDGLTITGAVVVQPTNINSEDIVNTVYARSTTKNSGQRR